MSCIHGKKLGKLAEVEPDLLRKYGAILAPQAAKTFLDRGYAVKLPDHGQYKGVPIRLTEEGVAYCQRVWAAHCAQTERLAVARYGKGTRG